MAGVNLEARQLEKDAEDAIYTTTKLYLQGMYITREVATPDAIPLSKKGGKIQTQMEC